MKLTHLKHDTYETNPWKNGKGITTEVYRSPPGADQGNFNLRISLAPITEDGPFSPFPGVDRRITLIEGAGLELDFGYHVLHLDPFEPQGFDTRLAPEARPSDGSVRVINVMARRDTWQFTECRVVTELDEVLSDGDLGVFFAANGTWVRETGETIGTHETLLAEGSGRLQMTGDGQAVFATLKPASNLVEDHYTGSSRLIDTIAEKLQAAGKNLDRLTTADLATIDEFHIRGRKATLELGSSMGLTSASRVLDIGSGLGGPARTIASTYGCHVTGIDLTAAFCEAAGSMSEWLGMSDQVTFMQGDATDMAFITGQFDAAMTIHVGMNIPTKDQVYAHTHRVLKSGGIFVVYDIVQGDGGEIIYPVPWARDSSISHVVTPHTLRALLTDAGFDILSETDSTEESQTWFDARVAEIATSGAPVLNFQAFLGDDFKEMAKSQVRNLSERRIGTHMFVCRA